MTSCQKGTEGSARTVVIVWPGCRVSTRAKEGFDQQLKPRSTVWLAYEHLMAKFIMNNGDTREQPGRKSTLLGCPLRIVS